jgi:hypothetical protein
VLVVTLAVVGLLTVPLAGGSLRKLGDRAFRLPALPVAALVAQAFVLGTPTISPDVAAVLHVATYVPLAVFIAVNRRRAGLWLLLAGMAMNSAAIVANGGVMPADRDALARAGIEESEEFRNSDAVDSPRLAWLGDVFAVPSGVPLANVFSVGDVMIVLAVAWFGHVEGASRLGRLVRPEPSPQSAEP